MNRNHNNSTKYFGLQRVENIDRHELHNWNIQVVIDPLYIVVVVVFY